MTIRLMPMILPRVTDYASFTAGRGPFCENDRVVVTVPEIEVECN